jgi:serine/threonine-protein kinase
MTGSTAPSLLDDLRRALAGRYDVERLLGAGGMGSVYLGRDVTLDRPVAIKVIAPELAAARVIRERFLQEARTVARLRHPSIVAVYAAGESDGMLYFVMEYVPGESLRALLEREGRLDDERGVEVLRDLACALAYAHDHGVVHRDVKPENVLLDGESGRALLTDFGVARALAAGADDGRMTGTGFVLGSPRYMSPEQASGERELDGRSDVYSLGLVGYEMFAGEPAIAASSAATMLVKQLTEVPAPVETRNQTVPATVAAAIGRALAKDPAERWGSAAEMADVIDGAPATPAGSGSGATARALRSAAHAPRRALPSPRGGGWARGPRRWALAAAAILLAAGGAGAWYRAAGAEGAPAGADPRKSYLVAPFEVLTGEPQLAWLREGSVSMLSANLAQWTDLSVVDYERSLDLLRDAELDGEERIGLEDARRLARRAGAGTVVMGQVTNTPDSLIVVARLYDVATGQRVDDAQRSAARTADPRPLYDALARDLLDLVGAPPITIDLARTTTSSVEAYRAYLDGVRALNRWQLDAADSLFRRATAADSTFALAYYKHALLLGWKSPGDSLQLVLARRAGELGTRLPPRERELVSAYTDFISAFTFGQWLGLDTARTHALFESAERKYAAIVARDSTDAEAWYGLGDAYFHHQTPGDGARNVAHWSRSLAAFNRTLALDSTFHLAYSHKVQIYALLGTAGSEAALDGDSLRLVSTPAQRAAFGAERLARAQAEARRMAVHDARLWISADPVPQAYQGLAMAYAGAGQYDSVVAVMREAMARPSTRSPLFPFLAAWAEARVDPTAAVELLRVGLRDTDPARIRREGGNPYELYGTVLLGADAAAVSGSVRELNQVAKVASALEPVAIGLPAKDRGKGAAWYARAVQLAMGLPAAPLRPMLDSGIVKIDGLTGPGGLMARRQNIAVPYVAYLATRDSLYLGAVRRWSPESQTWPELDALAALAAGDTSRVVDAVRRFPSVDSTRASGTPVSPMRWVARAEVLTAMGDLRRAVAMYELIEPSRFALKAPMGDPGLPLYPRSFLARGRLYEQLGEREKAAAAYSRFLDLWKGADAALQPQLREARAGLGRVRDLPELVPAPDSARG